MNRKTEMENKDIFDRIMELGILKPLYPIYHQHKEILLYLFFGGLTFIVSIGSYAFFEISIKLEPLIANIFSWILAVYLHILQIVYGSLKILPETLRIFVKR